MKPIDVAASLNNRGSKLTATSHILKAHYKVGFLLSNKYYKNVKNDTIKLMASIL